MTKKLFLSCVLAITAFSMNAQRYAGTSLYDRIGHGQDSIEVMNNLSLYQESYKARNYEEALEPWKYVFEHAPLAQIRVYTDGAWILESLIPKTTDPAKKQEYFNLLMKVYDQRLANLDDLNSFASKKTYSTKGNIICRKAYDFATFNPTPDNEKAYEMFRSGINDMGPNTEAFVLYSFIQCSYNRYVTDLQNTEKREDFINDYLQCTDICEQLLEQAKEFADDTIKAQKIVNNYLPTQTMCQDLFVKSGAADCKSLEKIYTAKVEENKANLEYLNSVLKVLNFFECDTSSVYYLASDYAYELNKTPQAAIGKAQKLLKDGNTDGSLKYFQEAIELEEDPTKKAKYAYIIAAIFYRKGSIGSCRQYCNEVLKYQPSNGNAWLLIASCIARSANGNAFERSKYYCLATDKCIKAKSVDPSCTAKANRQIASYSSYYYPKSEAFFEGIQAGQSITVMGETTTLRLR
jgi:tetratricopeptide (TPR) repeat protein